MSLVTSLLRSVPVPLALRPCLRLRHKKAAARWMSTDANEHLPRAIHEPRIFHDYMAQSFRNARMHLELKQDEVFHADHYILSAQGDITKAPTEVPKKEVCKIFSLSPRDLRLLDGKAPTTFSPTFLVRPSAIVYASSVLRAVITPKEVHIISAGDDAEGDQRLGAEEICQSLKTTLGLGLRNLLHPNQTFAELPFELRALEAVLYRITSGYAKVYQRLHHETWKTFDALREYQSSDNATHEDIRVVADARRAVEDFAARAKALQASVWRLLREDDHDLAGLYLTAKLVEHAPRQTADHEEAELMLEGILRRQDEIVASADLLNSDIIAVQKLMELGMAATRNRLLHLEIKLDIAMLAFSVSAAVFAAFGMNLHSGWEDIPGVFWIVSGVCFVGSAAVLNSGLRALAFASRRRYLGQIITNRHGSRIAQEPRFKARPE